MDQRKSGIELLRLVAMLMILLLHVNYMTFGFPSAIDINSNYMSSVSRIFLEQACTIAVNIYVFISGWFSIKPKLKSISNLIIQVITYSFLINICYLLYSRNEISLQSVWNIIIVGKEYWFIVSYLLLYILSPVLNAFAENSSKHQFKLVLFFYFLFEFIYGWNFAVEAFLYGYAAISFIGVYLLARYVKIYGLFIDSFSKLKLFLSFLVLTAIPTLFVLYSLKCDTPEISQGVVIKHIAYNSPFVLLSTICFFYIFQKLDFSNKAINYLSKSALAVYLIHVNPILFTKYTLLFSSIYISHPNFYGLCLMLGGVVLVLFACIAIDKIRILLTPINSVVSMLEKIGGYIAKCEK